MSDYLRIGKIGFIVGEYNTDLCKAAREAGERINDDRRFYDEFPPEEDRILTYLRCTVGDVEPGTTLGDVFRAVERYPLLEAFMSQYSWCHDIYGFHGEAKKPLVKLFDPESPGDDDPLLAVVVKQYSVIDDPHGHPYFGTDIYGRASGTGKYGYTKYGISLTPVNELAVLPIEIEKDGWDGMNLLQFLDAIYWEISFYGGTPDSRNDIRDTLRKTVAEIKGGLKKKDV
jgi:hypothetical protein